MFILSRNWINKLFSEENKVNRITGIQFEAGKVAGSATYKQK